MVACAGPTNLLRPSDKFSYGLCNRLNNEGNGCGVIKNKKQTNKKQEPRSCVKVEFAVLLKCCFTSTGTVGLLGTGAQDGHLDFHTAPEL